MTEAPFDHIVDEGVPALPVLLGSESGDVLATAVAPHGGSIRSSRVTQIRYTPGSAIVVRYRVDVGWNGGRSTREILIAASGLSVPENFPVLASGDVEIALWTYPNDPFLPGLATAAQPDPASRLLAQLGVDARRPRLRLRAYRPGRRAVVEVNTPRARVFLKVVRPSRVADLQAKHTELSSAVPVPHSHGWNKSIGLVALQAMPGKPLRLALESGRRKLPAAAQFLSMLDSFPDSSSAVTVKGPEQKTAFHARLLKAVTPELDGRIDAIVEQTSAPVDEPTVPVHGDFHSSQLLVRGSNLTGLIDVDTAGVGQRSSDLAVLLAHMSTVGLSTAARRQIDRYGAELIREFDTVVDPAFLRRKVAAAILGLATGPFRVNVARWPTQTERRIALAEQWIASADHV